MKKAVFLVLAMAAFVSVFAMAGTTSYATGPSNTFGTGFPTYGWSMENSQGYVTGFQGINPLLGYSAKYFFSPLKFNSWNTYWGWGTILLILPAYVSVGTDYVGKDGIYFGASLVNLVPTFEMGVMY